MIISASRRTDIPAFYAKWFINRVRAGFCDVPNPVRPAQVSRVSLRPEDVDVIVFWTRNAKPLIEKLGELDEQGFRYYFQYTLLDNPRSLDPGTPPLREAVETFRRLADCIGPDRVVWRYDPIVVSARTPEAFHLEKMAAIASALEGSTKRLVVSLADAYRHVEARLRALGEEAPGIDFCEEPLTDGAVRSMAAIAAAAGMEIASCAENNAAMKRIIPPGKCVDDRLIERVFGIRATRRKDPHQRPACGCVASRDIGVYDTCPCGCVYCYATRNAAAVAANRRRHDPESSSLIG